MIGNEDDLCSCYFSLAMLQSFQCSGCMHERSQGFTFSSLSNSQIKTDPKFIPAFSGNIPPLAIHHPVRGHLIPSSPSFHSAGLKPGFGKKV